MTEKWNERIITAGRITNFDDSPAIESPNGQVSEFEVESWASADEWLMARKIKMEDTINEEM